MDSSPITGDKIGGQKTYPPCEECSRTNHRTEDCKFRGRWQFLNERRQNRFPKPCSICDRDNHEEKDCYYKDVTDPSKIRKLPVCALCGKRGHLTAKCWENGTTRSCHTSGPSLKPPHARYHEASHRRHMSIPSRLEITAAAEAQTGKVKHGTQQAHDVSLIDLLDLNESAPFHSPEEHKPFDKLDRTTLAKHSLGDAKAHTSSHALQAENYEGEWSLPRIQTARDNAKLAAIHDAVNTWRAKYEEAIHEAPGKDFNKHGDLEPKLKTRPRNLSNDESENLSESIVHPDNLGHWSASFDYEHHISSNLATFEHIEMLKYPVSVHLRNAKALVALHAGVACPLFWVEDNVRRMRLQGCLYIPEFDGNVISIPLMSDAGFSVVMQSGRINFVMGHKIKAQALRFGDRFLFTNHKAQQIEIDGDDNKEEELMKRLITLKVASEDMGEAAGSEKTT